jgi:hypothetical protein
MRVVRYTSGDAGRWDELVRASKNGTFLLERAYMDYHADRFHDHSLMLFDDRERLIGVIPGHEDGHRFVSHAGLTFGGVVSGPSMTTPMMLDIFDCVQRYLVQAGFRTWRYKTIPYIYHRYPADEDRYALFRAEAKLYRIDVLSVIPMRVRMALQERRRRRIKSATHLGLLVQRSQDFPVFWRILESNLASRHRLKPVHTVDEMRGLQASFPDAIHLHLCKEADAIVAGVVVYDSPMVAHTQYIAASPRGMEIGALDFLLAHLIDKEYVNRPYFDFGSSNEEEGRVLNRGLVEHKEGFGARAVVHEFFELPLLKAGA